MDDTATATAIASPGDGSIAAPDINLDTIDIPPFTVQWRGELRKYDAFLQFIKMAEMDPTQDTTEICQRIAKVFDLVGIDAYHAMQIFKVFNDFVVKYGFEDMLKKGGESMPNLPTTID